MSHKNQGSKWITKKLRQSIYARDSHTCLFCGSYPLTTDKTVVLTLDHFEPRVRKGKHLNHPQNLITCCHRCNSSRQDRELASWLLIKFPGQWDIIFLRVMAHLKIKIR